MHRSYGYIRDFIRSHHEGLVRFVASVPSPQRASLCLHHTSFFISISPFWIEHVATAIQELWYHKNPAFDRSQNLLHMVLTDKKLHKIQATIREQLIPNFAVSLTEGDFTVVPNTEFVGIITGVRKERDVASYGKMIKAVVLEVFSDRKKVQCNVFGNACDLLEYDNLQKYPRSLLIVLESLKIKAIEVSKVDDDYFNPKEISNIQDLHADNGGAYYFVIGTIKEVMDEPDWWYYSCICGHAIVEHEDLYVCDSCGSCIEHVMVKYGIRVKIHDGGCAVLFVLLDNVATKLFGKTSSEAFLMIEEEFPIDPNVRQSYSSHMFDDVVGVEKIFKVEIHSTVHRDYSKCFKIVNVFSHNLKPAATDDYINVSLHGPIFPPIYDTYLQYATGKDYKTQVVCDNSIQSETIEDIITDLISPNHCYSDAENGGFIFILGTISSVLKNHKWWFLTCLCGSLVSANKNILSCDLCQLQCIDAIPRFCLKIVVSHTNGNNIFVLKDREVVQIIKTRCSSFLDNHPELNQGSYCKVVPLKLISSLLHKKVVFMVDARHVDYEMNRSIHVLVDSIPEVEDAFSQCGSDHEDVEDMHAF
ncbi:hypothetical protein Ahy_A07g035779 [Arachis hypogaea]|uniref:Replication factor A C-terminal domain-containing protein n=1 Tax=Arachis hypogaea TaxID=3818 RepID=A0A445CEH6_ARAHY|nr:hypothetical protein Ahy_A07g035779 [Arachis hypogaea]